MGAAGRGVGAQVGRTRPYWKLRRHGCRRSVGPSRAHAEPAVESPMVVSAASIRSRPMSLARHEGRSLLSASEALLKGVLETELGVAHLWGPAREPFASLFALAVYLVLRMFLAA